MEVIATKSSPKIFIPVYIGIALVVIAEILLVFLDVEVKDIVMYSMAFAMLIVFLLIAVARYIPLPKNLISYDKAAGTLTILKTVCKPSDIVTVRYSAYGNMFQRSYFLLYGATIIVVLKDKKIKIPYVREAERVHDRLFQLAAEGRTEAEPERIQLNGENI